MNTIKRLALTSTLAAALFVAPAASAEIQCPMGWVKEIHDSAVVCVAQNQNQNQAQVQNNNQNQNVNQNVKAEGGSSSSSSSSSSNNTVTINNPTPAIPQVVYTAPTKVTYLPATGLSEAALGFSAVLPVAGFALKKYGMKKSASKLESASSIWLEKNS